MYEESPKPLPTNEERARYMALATDYSQLLKDYTRHASKFETIVNEYNATLIRINSEYPNTGSKKLYDQCNKFIMNFQALCTVLTTLDDVYEEILISVGEIKTNTETIMAIESPQTTKTISIRELSLTFRECFGSKTDIKYLCSRLNVYNGLEDLSINSPEIASEDIQEMLFNVGQYCKARDRIPELVEAAIAERPAVEKLKYLSNIFRRLNEITHDPGVTE